MVTVGRKGSIMLGKCYLYDVEICNKLRKDLHQWLLKNISELKYQLSNKLIYGTALVLERLKKWGTADWVRPVPTPSGPLYSGKWCWLAYTVVLALSFCEAICPSGAQVTQGGLVSSLRHLLASTAYVDTWTETEKVQGSCLMRRSERDHVSSLDKNVSLTPYQG